MLEAAKEILEMVKHMPQYTLWVLTGILFYKVVIIGGWISIARLLINKTHDFLTKPRPPRSIEETWKLSDLCISTDPRVETEMRALLYGLREKGLSYLHYNDLEKLKKAIMVIENEKETLRQKASKVN